MFRNITTNKVHSHMFLSRHIREGVEKDGISRQMYVQQLLPAISRRIEKEKLCMIVIIPFSIIVCCLVVAWCSKNSILSKPKWGVTSGRKGGMAPLPSVATPLLKHLLIFIKTNSLAWAVQKLIFGGPYDGTVSEGWCPQIMSKFVVS